MLRPDIKDCPNVTKNCKGGHIFGASAVSSVYFSNERRESPCTAYPGYSEHLLQKSGECRIYKFGSNS